MGPRKHNRYRVGIPVIFSWQAAKEVRRQAVGLTRDMSLSGAFVLTTSPPPLGADIRLKGFLPPVLGAVQGLQIRGQGLVVRLEPALAGEPHGGFALAGKRFAMHRREEYR